jgi:NADH:ubiquinone reductase (H+-translocating)
MPRIVIIGAGFGGLWAARALAGKPCDVLLLDRNNYHTFLPLLYQVGAAEVAPTDIIYPVRSILRRKQNVRFIMDEVTSVDLDARMVRGSSKDYPYDYLLLALGSTSHFFGVEGAAQHAFQLKTLDDAIALRNHILLCFERALSESDPQRRQALLTFTIIGGGPTGVEFAGALAELVRQPVQRDYPSLANAEIRVVLLEAAPQLLPGWPEKLQAYTLRRLMKMGVEVPLQARVASVTPEAVLLDSGQRIPSRTVVWTAGVRGEALDAGGKLPLNPQSRVEVMPTLQVVGHHEVYAIGDLAQVQAERLPLIAPVAIQQGEWAAANILRQLDGQKPLPFRYRDPGSMVTIGRNAAVVRLGKRTFTGFIAWLMWLGVHLLKLIGFRNRLLVLINWAWDYLFYERAVRLIYPSSMRRLISKGDQADSV